MVTFNQKSVDMASKTKIQNSSSKIKHPKYCQKETT